MYFEDLVHSLLLLGFVILKIGQMFIINDVHSAAIFLLNFNVDMSQIKLL